MIDYCGYELKSCPFCGVDDLVRLEPGDIDNTFVVECNCCWAIGPFGYTLFDAMQKWNRLSISEDRITSYPPERN